MCHTQTRAMNFLTALQQRPIGIVFLALSLAALESGGLPFSKVMGPAQTLAQDEVRTAFCSQALGRKGIIGVVVESLGQDGWQGVHGFFFVCSSPTFAFFFLLRPAATFVGFAPVKAPGTKNKQKKPPPRFIAKAHATPNRKRSTGHIESAVIHVPTKPTSPVENIGGIHSNFGNGRKDLLEAILSRYTHTPPLQGQATEQSNKKTLS